jgi:hypothetical protein
MTPSVKVTFSEPVSNVTTGTVVLWDAVTWHTVSASVSLNDAGTVATLRPLKPLQPKHKYALRVSTWIVDSDDNRLTYASMIFTTAVTQSYAPARTLAFAAGTYTAYKFSSTGTVLATRAYTLARPSSAPTSKRSGVSGHSGGWYYITAGVWGGYWMREGAGITLQ